LLETPIDDPGDDRKNVAKLWELAGVEGPTAEKGFFDDDFGDEEAEKGIGEEGEEVCEFEAFAGREE